MFFASARRYVSLRLKKFPFRERHKILRAVPFEVEDEIPFSQNEAIFEAKVVRFEGKSSDVLAMACPKDRVKDVVQLAQDGGIRPSILSLETVALSNFLETWQSPPPEAMPVSMEMAGSEKLGDLLIDVGHVATKCMFYEDGALVGVRHIDWGGRNIITHVAQKYGLSVLQATKEVEAKAFIALDKSTATKEQAAFSKVIETAMMELVRELRLKILEVKADNHLNIVKANMTGGPTQIRGFGGFLTQHLEIAFNRIKLLSMLPNVAFEQDPGTEAVAGVAIGLAIEGLKRPRNPAVNFMKDDFASQSQTMERIWEKWGYSVKLGTVAFVLFFIYAFIRDSLGASMMAASEEALKAQAAAIANMKGSGASASKIKKFLSEHEKEQKARKQAERVLKLNSALDVLNAVSQALPDKGITIDVKRFSVENDTAEIQGYLLSGTRIGDLQTALQGAATSGKVESVTPQLSPQTGKVPFGFKFHVNRFEGGG